MSVTESSAQNLAESQRREAEQRARRAAGEAAAELVEPGMVLGLGTGDTAAYAIRAIAARAKAAPDRYAGAGGALWGLRCIATSRRSAELATQVGLTLLELDELEPSSPGGTTEAGPPIDLTIDGADEIDPQLQLVKGAGGALLFEKLVAQSSRRLLIIADPGKRVNHIGEKRLLPVEIVAVGSRHTAARILAVAGVRSATLRRTEAVPYRTDGGNLILDLQLEEGVRATELHAQLKVLCGVIETGLFCTEATLAIVGNPDGSVTRLARPNR
jgi:ribose 5-phosphate isomerase A